MGRFLNGSRSKFQCILILFLFLVVGCGSTEVKSEVISPNQSEYKYELTLSIAKDTTKEAIENIIDGKIIRWLPDAGLAIIATNEEITTDTFAQQGDLLDLFVVLSVEAGNNRVIAPVAQNGASAWSQGASAWSQGASAWSQGASAWSQGVIGGHFIENESAFKQINLFETHKKSQNFGEGITVAVIDTGFDLSHPIFVDHLSDSTSWKDFIDNDDLPEESASPTQTGYGHGTAVAGLVIQTAPRVKILPIRAIDNDGIGDTDIIAEAIEWAVSQGADVINLSLGSEEVSGAIEAMLLYAHNQGVYTVASAGNTGDSNVLFPASIANTVEIDIANEASWQDATVGWENTTSVIGVGSVDNDNKLSVFSAYGESLDMLAPGEGIITAFPNNQFATVSGTSFATPLVTGSIALTLAEPVNTIAPAIVLDVLSSTSKDIAYKNLTINSNQLGNGVLDTYNFTATGSEWPNITQQSSFTDDVNGFVYSDNTFTYNSPDVYAKGWLENDTRCHTGSSCLIVLLGGIDTSDRSNMSGGWSHSFDLEETAEIHVSFFARTSLADSLEANEYVEGNISLNGERLSVDGKSYFQRLYGSADKSHTLNSGWKEINISLGILTPGQHKVTIGAFQNQKTYSNEYTAIRIDDFSIRSEARTETVSPVNPNPTFNLKTNHSKCIGLASDSSQNSVNIQQVDCSNSQWEQFEEVPVAGGFLLRNIQSGKCLDVYRTYTSNETKVIQYQCSGDDNQTFNWSGYSLVVKHSNKCLELSNNSAATGANIWQYTCNGSIAQQFNKVMIEPLSNTAFGGTATSIPGKLEVENFDTGLPNDAYFDTSLGNEGLALNTTCRTASDVDTLPTNSGGCAVGWVLKGEWLSYSINVTQAGTYDIFAAVSSKNSGGEFEVEIDGTTMSTNQMLNTGDWSDLQEILLPAVSLSEGPHILKLKMVTASDGWQGYIGNFDYLRFVLK